MRQSNNSHAAIYHRIAYAGSGKDILKAPQTVTGLKACANQQGYRDTMTFCDFGYSGLNYDRPAFQSMVEHIGNGDIQAVVVKDPARISRNCLNFESRLDGVRKTGVSLLFYDGYEPFDPLSLPGFEELYHAMRKGVEK